MLDEVLKSLKIKGRCEAVKEHRHFRLFDIKLEYGQSIRKLESNLRELGLALRSNSIPLISIIPSKGIVQLQTTSGKPNILPFNELWNRNKDSQPNGLLQFLIGEEVSGKPVWLDIAACPHLLIAGSTGSGKSSLLHTIIANAKQRDDIHLYLSDPKHGVEFDRYEDVSLLIMRNYKETVSFLKWLAIEMEDRYELFREIKIRSLAESPFVVPKILFIIDEVSDLMLYDKKKSNPEKGIFENLVVQIAQKSRAVGIHLILATQRPSVDVITGLIKANFPGRISCKVSSATDSKIILDKTGAEHLLGRGDAILQAANYDGARFQVAYAG